MARKVNNTENYSAKNITSLSPIEHLKKKLNLTFGRELGDEESPFSSQKGVAYREYIDNSVGEIIRHFGNRLEVNFYKDGSMSVLDNGRGLPVDAGQNYLGETVNGVILTLGTLQSGENLGENSSGGKSTSQNGLGASAATVLSERVDVEVYKNGKIYYLSFKDGEPGYFDAKGNFKELADKSKIKSRKDDRAAFYKKNFKTGTYIKSKLDNKVFTSPYPVDVRDLVRRLKGVSYLLPHTYIKITDDFTSDETIIDEFYSENGIEEFLDLETTNVLTPIIYIDTKGSYLEKNVPIHNKKTGKIEHKDLDREVDIELAFNISNNFEYYQDTYVNTIRTRLGGVHLQAAEKAITDAFNERLSSLKSVKTNKDPDPNFNDYSEGLNLILSVYVSTPEFTSQIKEELGGKVLYKAIYNAIYDEVLKWSNQKKNFETMKVIGDKAVSAAKARIKSKELNDLRKVKNKLTKTTKMPAKLVDCEITNDEFSELYICEGDSAKTPLVSARNSKYQAILPIRGKILNTLKASPNEILKNKEVQDIIKCLDSGVGKDFSMEDARYQKVFIACDSDPDGAAISNLLITLFWVLMPDVVKEGRLHKVLTPLYILKSGKDTYYCLDKKERDEVISRKLKGKKYEITRAKGLGETGIEALYDTGMNPQTRRFLKITIDDINNAKEMLEVVMGDDPNLRKDWLEENPYIPESPDD